MPFKRSPKLSYNPILPVYSRLSLIGYIVLIAHGAQGGTRTRTPVRAEVFETSSYTNSDIWANKTHSLVPKAPASVGSSCCTNSRAVFLNPQDWGVSTPTTGVSTALRQGADNRTEIFFPFKERKIISTKFLHYLSDLININN